jgi:hypothetical protein
MKIYAREERRRDGANLVDVRVLGVGTLLKPGIVLLEGVAMDRVIEEERKV